MKRIIGIFIAILFLGYGLMRIGVGASLLAQTLEVVNFPDLADGVAEVKVFIEARAKDQILPFSLNGYFGYILAMGVLLSAGAAGALARTQLGYNTLGTYLVMYAALFVNFQEVNPKLIGLILQIVMLFLLYYLMPPTSDKSEKTT
jgi:hypothetical protein